MRHEWHTFGLVSTMNIDVRSIIFIFVGMALAATAWGQGEVFNPVKEALKTGSAKEVTRHLNQSVDMNLDGEVNTYSRAQGEFVLREFFRKHPPQDFAIIHTGSSKGGLQFAIGRYTTKTESFNVVIRAKDVAGAFLIHELNFEKE